MEKEKQLKLISEQQVILYEFFSSRLLKIKKPKWLHNYLVELVTKRARKKYEKYLTKFMTIHKFQKKQKDAERFKENTKKAINKLYSIPNEEEG